MVRLKVPLRVTVWKSYSKTILEDDLGQDYDVLEFSTALHGGFKECTISVPMPIQRAWLYMDTENRSGRHYHHLEITEEKEIVWEGRIMDIAFRADPEFVGLDITAMGYWSSCRDRYYDADDPGNTNWSTGGPYRSDVIIRELLNKSCPDINTDQSNISVTPGDMAGIDLTARAYPQDIIVEKIVPTGDSSNNVYYFAIWESRKPHWKKRSVSQVDAYAWLRDISVLTLRQQGKHIRNHIIPLAGTVEGQPIEDGASQVNFPRRELLLELPKGVKTDIQDAAKIMALSERKRPTVDSSLEITGRVYTTKGAVTRSADGALTEMPKWRMRAGYILRVQDLVPATAISPTLDDTRTFFLLETVYDAVRDRITVVPDRPSGRLDVLINRLGTLELVR